MNFKHIEKAIRNEAGRSAWSKGVNRYALDLLDGIREGVRGGWIDKRDLCNARMIERHLLNGAPSWQEYSWGGCSLIYDTDIAKRLCAPYELRAMDNGRKDPNHRERWLDTQARALFQAAAIVTRAILANQ